MHVPIFWWYGGKYYLLRVLLARIPPHRVYIEPFGGAANLLLAKPPSTVEIYGDIHGDVVHFFRVLRCPLQGAVLKAMLELTPYARAEFEAAGEPLPPESEFEGAVEWADEAWRCIWAGLTPAQRRDIERARRFYVRQSQSFNGAGLTWSRPNGNAPRNRARHNHRVIQQLDWYSQRMRHVIIENCHWRDLLPDYDIPDAFWYLDPPYVLDAREGGKVYTHEMSNADHEELVAFLLTVRHAQVMVSGYAHPIYEPLERAGWRVERFTVAKRASGRAQHYGTECLWRNYEMQPALFTQDG